MSPWRLALVVLAASLAGCGGEGGGGLGPLAGLPSQLQLRGQAAGPRGDGGVIDCSFHLILTLSEHRRTGTYVEYTGTHGGDVMRTTVDSTGAGFSFWADVYWPNVVARLVFPDSLEWLLGDTTITDSRFWREIAFFAGARRPGDPGSGAWTCAPFDLNSGGYVDTMGTVTGTWWVDTP